MAPPPPPHGQPRATATCPPVRQRWRLRLRLSRWRAVAGGRRPRRHLHLSLPSPLRFLSPSPRRSARAAVLQETLGVRAPGPAARGLFLSGSGAGGSPRRPDVVPRMERWVFPSLIVSRCTEARPPGMVGQWLIELFGNCYKVYSLVICSNRCLEVMALRLSTDLSKNTAGPPSKKAEVMALRLLTDLSKNTAGPPSKKAGPCEMLFLFQ